MKNIVALIIAVACLGLFSTGCTVGSFKQGNLKLNDFKYLVVPKSPNSWDKMAEQEIQYYFHKITGTNLETITETGAAAGNIFLGAPARTTGLLEEKAIADIKDNGDGFAVAADGRNVAIYSKNSIGSIYGVYAFLAKLGLKTYAHDCEALPRADMAVPEFKLTSNPAFSRFSQDVNFYYYPQVLKAEDFTRLGYSPNRGGSRMEPGEPSLTVAPGWIDPVFSNYYGTYYGIMTVHCLGFLVPPYLYLEKHPEYYARDKNGKVHLDLLRDSSCRVHLCLSNPEVFKIVLERMLFWMEKTPLAKYYDFTAGDNWNWCQCPACTKLDPPDVPIFPGEFNPVAHMSDRVLWFVNQLARETRKQYPDKIILASAYQATADPPRLIKTLEPNVCIQLCSYYSDGVKSQSHDLLNPLNERFLNNFAQWKKLAPQQLYVFEYPMNYENIYAPFFSHDAARKKTRYYHEQGVKGVEYCGQPYLFAKMFMYVQGKLRWDPCQPTDNLEADFLKAYYGPAAEDMQAFLNLMRAQIYDPKNPVYQADCGTINALISPAFVSEAYQIFARAETAVKDRPPYYERVRYEKLCGVLWGDLDQHITKNEIQRFIKLKELADICRAAPDNRSISRLTSGLNISMAEWLQNKFFVALPDGKPDDWYDTPLIKKLSACGNEKEIEGFINGLAREKRAGQQEIGGTLELLLDGFTVYGSDSRSRIAEDGEYGLLLNGGDSAMTTFILPGKPAQDTTLRFLGRDHDKPGRAKFTLGLNGHIVFQGENGFAKKGWSEMTIALPAQYLQAGENALEIRNIEERVTFTNWIYFRKPCLAIPSRWQVLKQWEYAGTRPTNDVSMHNAPGYGAQYYTDNKVYAPIGNPVRVEINSNPSLEREGIGSQIQLAFAYTNKKLKSGDQLRTSFWAKSAGATAPVTAVLMQSGPPFAELGPTARRTFMVDGAWRQIRLETEITTSCEVMAIPRLFLGNVAKGSVLYFSPIVAEYQEK